MLKAFADSQSLQRLQSYEKSSLQGNLKVTQIARPQQTAVK